jgi:hypothetical protein
MADTTAELADGERGVESVSYKPKTSNSSDIPYVPLPGFWRFESDLRCGRSCNLLHSVNKLLQTHFAGENRCRLFTNCLQSVATYKNPWTRYPDAVTAFPSTIRGSTLQ